MTAKPLTDARRFYVLIRDSEAAGFHSHDARSRGITGNPSQRAKDIVSTGQVVLWTARESRNGRPGSRWWLDGWQPDHATRVRPNHSQRTCDHCGKSIEDHDPRARFCDSTCRAAAWKADNQASSVPERSCRRCEGSGRLPSGRCVACAGTGLIEAGRINSYVDDEQVAA